MMMMMMNCCLFRTEKYLRSPNSQYKKKSTSEILIKRFIFLVFIVNSYASF